MDCNFQTIFKGFYSRYHNRQLCRLTGFITSVFHTRRSVCVYQSLLYGLGWQTWGAKPAKGSLRHTNLTRQFSCVGTSIAYVLTYREPMTELSDMCVPFRPRWSNQFKLIKIDSLHFLMDFWKEPDRLELHSVVMLFYKSSRKILSQPVILLIQNLFNFVHFDSLHFTVWTELDVMICPTEM